MTLHDFDAARRERNREREPLQFKLGGETFTCLAVIPAGLGYDLLEIELTGDQLRIGLAYRDFILAVLATKADRDRFEKVLRQTKNAVEPLDLRDVVVWLAEQYGGRPTQRSSDSSDGPPANGASSKPARSGRARRASKSSDSGS